MAYRTPETAASRSSVAERPGVIIGMAALAALLLAAIPWLSPLNFPIRLLVTIVHELSHGIAAVLTGGRFVRFVVFPDGGGLAYTAGGWRLLVIPAGYLGSALFGAALIVLGRNARWSRTAMAVLGVLVVLLTLRYGLPSVLTAQWVAGLVTVISGVALGAGFFWLARRASATWIVFITNLVAIQAGLTAFSDLLTLIGISTQFFTPSMNDAQAMAEITFIPAIIWALVWAALTVLLIGGAMWSAWLAPHARKRSITPLAHRR